MRCVQGQVGHSVLVCRMQAVHHTSGHAYALDITTAAHPEFRHPSFSHIILLNKRNVQIKAVYLI